MDSYSMIENCCDTVFPTFDIDTTPCVHVSTLRKADRTISIFWYEKMMKADSFHKVCKVAREYDAMKKKVQDRQDACRLHAQGGNKNKLKLEAKKQSNAFQKLQKEKIILQKQMQENKRKRFIAEGRMNRSKFEAQGLTDVLNFPSKLNTTLDSVTNTSDSVGDLLTEMRKKVDDITKWFAEWNPLPKDFDILRFVECVYGMYQAVVINKSTFGMLVYGPSIAIQLGLKWEHLQSLYTYLMEKAQGMMAQGAGSVMFKPMGSMLIATLGALVSPNITGPGLQKYLADFGRVAIGFTNMQNLFTWIQNTVLSMYYKYVLNKDYHEVQMEETYPMITDVFRKARLLKSEEFRPSFVDRNKELAEGIIQLENQMLDIRAKAIRSKDTNVAQAIAAELATIQSVLIAARNSPAHTYARREPPLMLYLYGSSGVGKSFFKELLTLHIYNKYYKDSPTWTMNNLKFTRTVENEYWDGYLPDQPIVEYDDILQIVDSKANPNPELMEIIRIKNDTVYHLHMAALEDKKNSFFTSKFVLATSNVKKVQAVSLKEPNAFTRRFDVAVEVKIAPMYAKTVKSPSGTYTTLDHSKVTGQCDTDVWRLDLFDLTTGDTIQTGLTWDQFITHFDATTAQVHSSSRNKLKAMMEKLGMEYKDSTEDDDTFASRFKAQGEIDYKRATLMTPEEFAHTIDVAKTRPIGDIFHNCEEKDETPEVEEENNILTILKSKAPTTFVDLLKKIDESSFITQLKGLVKGMSLRSIFDKFIEKSTGMLKWIWNAVSNYKMWPPFVITMMIMAYKYMRGSVCEEDDTCPLYYALSEEELYDLPLELLKDDHTCTNCTGICREHTPESYGKNLDYLLMHADPPVSKIKLCTWSANYRRNVLGLCSDTMITGAFNQLTPVLMNESGEVKTLNAKTKLAMESNTTKTLNSRQKLVTESNTTKTLNAQVRRMVTEGSSDIIRDEQMQTIQDRNTVIARTETCTTNGVFVRGRQLLVPYHLIDGAKTLNLLKPGRSDGNTYDLTDLNVTQLTNIRGEKVDFALIDITNSTAHRDIVGMFTDGQAEPRGAVLSGLQVRGPDNIVGTRLLAVPTTQLMTEEYDTDNGKTYKVNNGISYALPTRRGDCGFLLYTTSKRSAGKIIGMHVAGSNNGVTDRGFSYPITKQFLERNLDIHTKNSTNPARMTRVAGLVAQSLDTTTKIKDPLSNYGNCTVMGSLPAPRAATKTELSPSLCVGVLQAPTTKPAFLRPFVKDGQTINPLTKGIKKVLTNTTAIPSSLLKAAKADVFHKLRKNMQPLRVLTYEEAVCGIPGKEFITPMNRKTSPGYPFTLNNPGTGKRHWFGYDEEMEVNEEIRNKVNEIIDACKRNERPGAVWTATLKDERRPIAKVDEGKTRVFAAAPMDYGLAVRMYFLDAVSHIMENRIDNEIGVGTNPFSLDWNKTALKLRSKGKHVLAGDFSNFDGSLLQDLLWCVCDILNALYDDENVNVREVLFEEILNARILVGNQLIECDHSQPSGNPLTVIINSIFNMMVMRIAYLICAHKASVKRTLLDFENEVSMQCYGDDNVLNISSAAIDWYNQITITSALAEIGLTYTDEAKTGELIKARTLEEVAYLKRGFVRDSFGMYKAPLAKEVCYEMTNWIRGNRELLVESSHENCVRALEELSLHSEQEYAAAYVELEPFFRDYKRLPSFEECLQTVGQRVW